MTEYTVRGTSYQSLLRELDILQVAPRIICVAKLRLSGAREDLLYAEVTPALELLVAHDQLAEEDLLADELKLEVTL